MDVTSDWIRESSVVYDVEKIVAKKQGEDGAILVRNETGSVLISDCSTAHAGWDLVRLRTPGSPLLPLSIVSTQPTPVLLDRKSVV